MPPSRSDSGLTPPKYAGPISKTSGTSINGRSGWLSRQVDAMASAWTRGQEISAAELLVKYPGLDDEAAIRLIYEEVSLRRESGHEVATAEVVNRYPRWKDELEFLLGADRMLRPFCRVAAFPGAGEELGPFQLMAELGRGGSGRTYLASEPALGGRLIVVKVIADDQEEHLSLARLQHTHIIPLYAEQSFPERRLRALCMPYLGGASLALILDSISRIPVGERRGRHLVEVLDQVHAGQPERFNRDGPWRRRLEQARYVDAVCSIAACLADALQSAHAHGLLHMDVKPSNVLIAGDGLPLLLDFHLAHRPIGQGEQIVDRVGGTPGWMAPEHRAVLEAAGRGERVPWPVDGRADLFALGLLLREALVGSAHGAEPGTLEPWRHKNPEVSAGLADIVDKCLAPLPANRYPDGATLADDLRRHLSDLPLRGVANRSLAERWRKWRRRRPAALSRWTAGLVILAAAAASLGLAQAYFGQGARAIATALEDGRKLRQAGRFAEAAQTLARGIEQGRPVPGTAGLERALHDELVRARNGERAAAVHELAELVRFRYGIDLPAEKEARALADHIRTIWHERAVLLEGDAGSGGRQAGNDLRADLLDLVIAWVELSIGLESKSAAPESRRDALRILDEAAASCGTGPRLDRLRRSLAGGDGDPKSGARTSTRTLTALEHFDLGRIDLRAGRFKEASLEFQRVLDDRPLDFWSNFYLGLCDYRLGRLADALAEFGICAALQRTSAECYHNRARVAEAMGRLDQATRDYSRAVDLDPRLTPALLNRGVIAYKNGRYAAAVLDLERALDSAADSTNKAQIHYNLALACFASGDRTAALTNAQASAALGDTAAPKLLDRLRREP
jgi:serine/threonine protein kinase/tetratricopeptide (TPR) repeat protein